MGIRVFFLGWVYFRKFSKIFENLPVNFRKFSGVISTGFFAFENAFHLYFRFDLPLYTHFSCVHSCSLIPAISKNMAPSKGWVHSHFNETVDAGGKLEAECKYCAWKRSQNVTRMFDHINVGLLNRRFNSINPFTLRSFRLNVETTLRLTFIKQNLGLEKYRKSRRSTPTVNLVEIEGPIDAAEIGDGLSTIS
jgi:hypothetical protein